MNTPNLCFLYLSVRLLRAVVVAAIIINNHFSVFIVQARGGNQLPAAAVLGKVIPGRIRFTKTGDNSTEAAQSRSDYFSLAREVKINRRPGSNQSAAKSAENYAVQTKHLASDYPEP